MTFPVSGRTVVPVEPFMAWLAATTRRIGRQGVRDGLGMSGETLLAYEALVPGDTIAIDLVDKYVTRADDGTTIWSLYPDLDVEHGRRTDYGRSYVCDEQILIAAHSLHMDGMSVRQVAREIFDDCYSASPKALANALLGAWRARGWEVRSRSDATALANRQRAWRPRCSHIHQIGERAGTRCVRQCVGNDQTCWKHDPARIAAATARLREGSAA